MLPSASPVIKITICLQNSAIPNHFQIKNTGLACSKNWNRSQILHSVSQSQFTISKKHHAQLPSIISGISS
jgi:hypothetical protein